MTDLVPYLLGLLLVAALLLCLLIVLPIIALLRTQRIVRLSARLDRLERELARLRRREPEQPVRPETAAVVSLPPTTPEAGPDIPEVLPAAPVPPQPAPASGRPADAFSLEAWIGRRGLGWVAVVLLLFAAAFFIKYAFDNQWVGELGRVAIGVLAGAALCGLGMRHHRRGWRVFSQMLLAAGVVLLYLATFGAFGYYHLVPRGWAGLYLGALVVETMALAVLLEAPAIALMAVVGGLLNPLLLHSDHDQYASLFLYLAVMDAGVVGLVLFRRWPAVATVALVGTQALFWAWYAEHYHPEKLSAALGFQAAVFLLFLAYGLVAGALLRREADIEDLVRLVLNTFLFAAAGYTLLDEDYHVWLGTLALCMAVLYTACGWLLFRRRPEDLRHLFVVVATALAFVAMVFPLQAEAAWIALGWAVEGVVLVWFGLRIGAPALRGIGAILLVLAVGRLVLIDTPRAGRAPFVPLFNKYALPALAVAGCVLGAALALRRFRRQLTELDVAARWVAGLGAALLVWLILSIEAYQYFIAQEEAVGADAASLERMAQTSLSVVWAGYAALLLGLGFRLRNLPLRWTALALFGLTLAKVILVDMAFLPGFYRVAAFLVLAVMMGLAAWGYQKIERMRPAPERGGSDRETT